MQEKIRLTVPLEEIAKQHKLNLKTLRRWASERRFPLYKISNRIRVSPEEFFEWVQKFHVKGSKWRVLKKDAPEGLYKFQWDRIVIHAAKCKFWK